MQSKRVRLWGKGGKDVNGGCIQSQYRSVNPGGSAGIGLLWVSLNPSTVIDVDDNEGTTNELCPQSRT
jgi:hypothetical protein